MIDLRPDHLDTVQRILAEHVPECEVRAFGSRAAWTAKDYSDLDIAVVGAGPLDWRTLGRLKEAFEESSLPMRVDVLDWHAIPESFRRVIKQGYVVLQEAGGEQTTAGEWQEASLGEVIELKRGYDLPQRKRIPGSVPLVSSSGVTYYHTEAKVRGPGVVTGRYGTLGEVFFVPSDFWPLNTTLYVRDFKGNDPRFISYFLRGLDFSAYSDKAAVPGLNRNHLHQAAVRYPPSVAEQRAIAHVLGTLDDKIELNRRMNETLEAMVRALFKDWFVDFGPIRAKMAGREPYLPPDVWSLFPDRLAPSELGDIPAGWQVGTVGDVAAIVGGTTPSTKQTRYWEGGKHCWVTPRDLASLSTPVLLETERKITDAGLDKIGSGLLPRGAVLLSSRAPIGYLAVAETLVAINQGFIGILPREGVSNLFMLHWSKASHDEIIRYANGSTFLEISKGNFRRILLVMPEEAVMTEFDKFVRPLYERIVSNERESRALAALRTRLLPSLVSGTLKLGEK